MWSSCRPTAAPRSCRCCWHRFTAAEDAPVAHRQALGRALAEDCRVVQAEAVADLIESATGASARAAQRSLEGVFSEQVNDLREELIRLRVFIEAALDFPDEEIDFLSGSDVLERLAAAGAQLQRLLDQVLFVKTG